MAGALTNKHVVLGVTGSIACYKALDLASKLVQGGALVDTIMSYGATQFVTPLAFRSITHRPVVTDSFDANSEYSVEHVALAQQADVIVVAPATVHCIAKMALGLADDPLTTTIVAAKCPLVIAPAMDGNMYDHPATQSNIVTLTNRGVVIAGPGTGRLASGLSGVGRLLETPELMGYISYAIAKNGDLSGRTVVVSAGGTMEPIDPVRVITNLSSGKMGYALAEAARDRGADVVLVTASTNIPNPAMVKVVQIQTAEEMRVAIQSHLDKADALVMAAAVADYKPSVTSDQKIKKSEDDLNISLAKTTDILKTATGSFVKVGFAAESQNLVENAKAKITSKKLDLIVANDITAEGSGFGSDTNKVTLIDRDMRVDELPLLTKYDVSNRILDRVSDMLGD